MGRRRTAGRHRWGSRHGTPGAIGPSARGAAVIAAVVLALTGVGGSSSPRPSELVLEPAVLAKLQTLAEGLHKEIVLCLTGLASGDTAYATGFVMPAPRLSTPTRSSFDACPTETLASWHNHPRAGSSSAAVGARAGWDDGRASRWLCVLSDTDIRTAERLAHPFIVVSVDASTWCWWNLSEVTEFARQAISPAPPAPERIAQQETSGLWALPDEADER
ncbi:MAG: hypothetical protein ACRELC_14775 [Gemmatimonadota bacterium]